MKASDIIFKSNIYPESRGELTDLLCDIGEEFINTIAINHLSEGVINDLLFICLDKLIITPEQLNKLKQYLKDKE